MSTREIVVRLSLNATQFSTEMSRAYGALERASADTASRAKSAFERSFADIKRLAESARVDGAGITIDTASARQAAAAAQQQAIVLDQVAQAAQRAAIATGDTSEETRLYLQAAVAAKNEAQQQAAALTAEANALDRLQAELGQTTRATGALTVAHRNARLSAGQQRVMYQQLGFQMQDVTASFASGINPLVILAQQGGQTAAALSGLGGVAGRVATFMAGPWGAAILGATTVIGLLASRSGEAEKATEELGQAQRTGVGAAEALAEATRALDQITGRTKKTAGEAKVEALLLADAYLRQAEAARVAAESAAALARARVDERRAEAVGGRAANFGALQQVTAAEERAIAAEKRLADLNAKIAEARQAIATGLAPGNFAGRFLRDGRFEDAIEARRGVDEVRTRVSDTKKDVERTLTMAQQLDRALAKIERVSVYTRSRSPEPVDAARELEEIVADADKRAEERFKDRIEAERRATEERIERERRAVQDLAGVYEEAMRGGTGSIWRRFKEEGKRAIAEIAAVYTLSLISGQGAPGLGSVIGSLSQSNGVFGPGGGILSLISGTGAGRAPQVGGRGLTVAQAAARGIPAPGNGVMPGDQPVPEMVGSITSLGPQAGPIGLAIAAGQMIGKALGNDQLKNGELLTLLLGPFIARLVGSTLRGSATLGFSSGELGVVSTRGNSRSRVQQSSEAAGGVADALRQIAEQVGGELTGPVSTSIGVRKKSFRVDTTGQGRTKLRAGVLDFGQDAEAAAEAAIRDALSDGVISGISQASRNILASGRDLQKAIEEAVAIESIPKRLKEIDDPFGARLDELNREFADLKRTLEAAGGTAQQLADAERLYNLERKELERQLGDRAAGLRAFLDDLRGGPGSPLSLRDQSAAARARLDPFLADIAAGRTIDQQAYQEAASRFLDVQRQLFGSTEGFFAEFDRIQAATNKAIEAIDKANPVREASPFARETAEAAKSTAANTLAVAEIGAQTNALLTDVAGLLRTAIAGGGAGGFIGDRRAFV